MQFLTDLWYKFHYNYGIGTSRKGNRSYFTPCSKAAREVLKYYAIQIPDYKSRWFGCYSVHTDYEHALYEACSHDGENPQTMMSICRLGVISDAP